MSLPPFHRTPARASRRGFFEARSGPQLLAADRRRRWAIQSRGLSRGFTLLELMAVVIIVAILAAIAVPGAANRFRENRAQRAANEVASVYRNARMRAMGRGSAVLVRWDAASETFQVLEAIEGGATDCRQMPAAHCRLPAARWQPGAPDTQLFQVLGTFSPDDLGDHATTFSLEKAPDPDGGFGDLEDLPSFDVCFSPMGTTYGFNGQVTNDASVLQPLAGLPVVTVARESGTGLTRRVLILPNGNARVVAVEPTP